MPVNRSTTVLTALSVTLLVTAVPITTAGTVPGHPPAAISAPAATYQRGALLSVELVEGRDAAGVVERMRQFRFDTSGVRFGVDAYRIEYRTVDPQSRPTVASGLVALPRTARSPLPLAAWLHGTRAHRDDVGSVAANNMDHGAALLLAGAGYATVAPDYLGLGTAGPAPVHARRADGVGLDRRAARRPAAGAPEFPARPTRR